jgi:hypothetical protein
VRQELIQWVAQRQHLALQAHKRQERQQQLAQWGQQQRQLARKLVTETHQNKPHRSKSYLTMF